MGSFCKSRSMALCAAYHLVHLWAPFTSAWISKANCRRISTTRKSTNAQNWLTSSLQTQAVPWTVSSKLLQKAHASGTWDEYKPQSEE